METGGKQDAAAFLARRESSIVLDREGRFLHDGSVIEHPGIVRAFRRWLGRGEGGRFVLRASEREWCFLGVEDAAAWVEDVAVESGRLVAGLWDGSREVVDPATLAVDREGVLRCTVRDLPARFSRHAQLSLGALLEPADAGAFWLALGDERVRIPSLA